MNNFEEEYYKLFNYFLNRIDEDDKVKIKTFDDLINIFNNYDIAHQNIDFTDYHDYYHNTLENLTNLINLIKDRLNGLDLPIEYKEKIDEIINESIKQRKNIYISENDDPEPKHEPKQNLEIDDGWQNPWILTSIDVEDNDPF